MTTKEELLSLIENLDNAKSRKEANEIYKTIDTLAFKFYNEKSVELYKKEDND